MSRIRGVFPLFLATTFGILNGIAIFGPAFKEQQEEKLKAQNDRAVGNPVPDKKDGKGFQQAESDAIIKDATISPPQSKVSEGSDFSVMKYWEEGKQEQAEASKQDISVPEYPPGSAKS
ncbi:MAG: hypothetical protein M1827_005091 [Pycnora praestabilis]|nr:MAG: hypothetical protein M1827_005091 [Pycnora praestabilis]